MQRFAKCKNSYFCTKHYEKILWNFWASPKGNKIKQVKSWLCCYSHEHDYYTEHKIALAYVVHIDLFAKAYFLFI